jgi:hypothetical protein
MNRHEFATVLLASLAILSTARAAVDAEVGGSVAAKGNLGSSEETASFRFSGVTGSVVTVTAKGKPGLVPSLEILNASEEELDPGITYRVAGTKAQIKGLVLPSTSLWQVVVGGEGAGEYTFTLKVKSPKSINQTLNVNVETGHVLNFAAPTGSALTLVAKTAAGSAAIPRFGVLMAEDGDPIDLTGTGNLGSTSHSTVVAATTGNGNLSIFISNAGGADGDVNLSIKIKAPKVKKEKLDLRSAVLGMPGGGETYLSESIGSDGGAIAVTDGELEGASLTIPAGALDAPVRIAMASAPAPSPVSDDDQAAGPAVDLRPSGLVFDEPATLVLPFDPALIPGNRSPSDVRVLIVEADGSTMEVNPVAIDLEAKTVTLPLGGFTICIPIIRSGITPLGVAPGGDEFWNLTLEAELEPDTVGTDSRARWFLLEVGESSFFGDGTVQTSSSWRSFSLENETTFDGINHGIQAFESAQEYVADWTYGADGRTIEIVEGDDGGAVLAASRNGSILIEYGEEADDQGVGWSLLLRKSATPWTVADFKGAWTMGGIEISADTSGSANVGSIEASREYGTVIFDGEGGFKATASGREAVMNVTNGNREESSSSFKGSGTYSVSANGTLAMQVDPEPGDEGGDPLRAYPGREGNVMFVVDDGPCGPCTYALILVRQGSGMGTSDLAGDFLGSTFAVDLRSYAPIIGGGGPTQFAGDAALSVMDFEWAFDGDNSALLDASEHQVRREEDEPQGIRTGLEEFTTTLGIGVSSKGQLTFTEEEEGALLVGALSPDGMFAFLVTNPSLDDTDFLLGMMVKALP